MPSKPKGGTTAGWAVQPDDSAVRRYLERAPYPVRDLAADLDALVRAAVPEVTAGIKWSVPFYARKGPLCYISAAKTHVTFGLVQGVDVPDASGILTGTGKSPIRKAVFEEGASIPRGVVRGWLRHAKRMDETWPAD